MSFDEPAHWASTGQQALGFQMPPGDWNQEKVCLGWRGCVKRLSLHRSPQAAPSPPVRMQTPQARKCSLEPWKEQRSTESWGRCQTPSFLLRLERRERLTYGKVSIRLPLPGDAVLVAEAWRQLALPASFPSHPYLPVSRIQFWVGSSDEQWVRTSPCLQGAMGMEDQMVTGGCG